ncbi:MAG: GNAT family N-acetyltransferase [Thermofilum sp.]|jgi:GNAT superfamily N-acetyltransferase|nr:GNAT family N-acetyltransferase [Thermofilum sp.]
MLRERPVELETTIVSTRGFRLSLKVDGEEVAHCYIYLVKNDLHDKPYALLEDVYVEEAHRGKGIGRRLVLEAIELAKRQNCYKMIATSRFGREALHEWYEKLGFRRHGLEFRIDFA